MSSEKTGNNQEKRIETRGRKPLKNKSVKVSWRIPHEIYKLLEDEQKNLEELTGVKFPLSAVFSSIVKKELK